MRGIRNWAELRVRTLDDVRRIKNILAIAFKDCRKECEDDDDTWELVSSEGGGGGREGVH